MCGDYHGGQDVAILGGGTVGMFTAQWARIFGAKRVFVFDIDNDRLQLAKSLGADVTINTLDKDFKEQLDQYTNKKGFGFVYETAGVDITMKLAFEIAGNKSSVCFIGTPTKDLVFTPKLFENMNRKEFKLTGSWMSYSAPFPGVIEAVMERALKNNEYVLIEATANQVNQFGGYTGMKPSDFSDFVYSLANRMEFPKDKIILGGDHLGPLTWKNEKSDTAMEKSSELFRQYVLAGFTKIHIDTSMHLADDNVKEKINTKVIAQRGAALCKVAEDAYHELLKTNPQAVQPVYVVGSEVPIPGGSQEEEEGIQVTKVNDFEATVETFKQAFYKLDLQKAWDNVIAVVVQPGVEFGDETIHEYNREAAKELCQAVKRYPSLVFEGHSTDYQTPIALKQMVEDGISILKVGPALTLP